MTIHSLASCSPQTSINRHSPEYRVLRAILRLLEASCNEIELAADGPAAKSSDYPPRPGNSSFGLHLREERYSPAHIILSRWRWGADGRLFDYGIGALEN